MGFLSFLFKRANETPAPDDDFWYTNTFYKTAAGQLVTYDSALASTAVYAAIRRISGSIAMLPCITYKDEGDAGKSRADSLNVYRLLRRKPNDWMTAPEFFEMMAGHVLLRGNAYAVAVKNGRGQTQALIPLHPERVTPRMVLDDNNKPALIYEWNSARQGKIVYRQDEIVHFKGLSSDGITGTSPVSHAREAVGLTLALEQHESQLFSNFAKPGGILTHPGKLDDKARERLKEAWQRAYAGTGNSHKTAVLEEGMKWEQVGMDNQDAEFIAARRFQLEDIARIFEIPPHMIGDLSHATFSNIEHQNLNYVTFTLMPWLRKFEEALTSALLPEGYFVEFLVTALLRGDVKSRQEALAIQRQNGIINADEWRRIENMNPLPDGQGEAYLLPLNMVDARDAQDMSEPKAQPTTGQPDDEEDDEDEDEEMRGKLLVCISSAAQRAVVKECKALQAAEKKNTDLVAWHDSFLKEHRWNVGTCVEAAVHAYAHYRKCKINAEQILEILAAFDAEQRADVAKIGAVGGYADAETLVGKWMAQKSTDMAQFIASKIDARAVTQ